MAEEKDLLNESLKQTLKDSVTAPSGEADDINSVLAEGLDEFEGGKEVSPEELSSGAAALGAAAAVAAAAPGLSQEGKRPTLADLPSEEETYDGEKPLDKNLKLMSPGRMVARRFFRSKLSIVGLVMVISLILFSWLGPVFYTRWGETQTDYNGPIEYQNIEEVTVTDDDGNTYTFTQVVEVPALVNERAYPSLDHLLGTDNEGLDVFVRLMYGGQKSIAISFIAVFAITIIGVVFGGIAGYFGGKVDNVIMRICDILMCLPGLPILLILGSVLDAIGIKGQDRIYYLMIFLTVFSWSGTARLVRGQILFLREQEYMVAAEAMGFSTARKIFKHLVPNVMPQLIVSMTLSLGSIILYEASLSYLGLGVQAPFASWGGMINKAEQAILNPQIGKYNYFWLPPGICIIIAVLGFNFVGDGLRDALDPKMRR